MKNVDIFLQTYNDLDKEIKNVLGGDTRLPHVKALDRIAKKNKLIAKNLDMLKLYAKLRNCIVHNTISGIEKPIATPLPEVVEDYKKILNRFKNPLTVYDICTYRSKLIVCTPNQLSIDVMNTMTESLVTRVPVLKSEKVVGVFNGNTLIHYMTSLGNPSITKETTIQDLMQYTTLETYRKEHFEFVKRGLTVYEAETLFKTKNKDNHKLIALFITSDGTREGKLLGMLTEWDLFNEVH